MKITIYSQDGQPQGDQEIKLRDDFKGISPQVIHDVITAHRAAQRSGTACTKTIAEVAGSGKKPWRQKGTGRARAGLARSPIWRKGGVVFGPKPRDYSKTVPKRVKKLAFEQALSTRIRDGDVIVLDALDVKTPKTRDFAGILKGLKVDGRALIVHEAPSKNLRLASRNMEWVATASAESLNTYQLLDCKKIVLTRAALEKLAARTASGGTPR
ncbi:MAG: 50S ribosomal protein L4 [Verrucomicrobia bacterium]|nr:50S ribosomal protein L4 [Verrucomicrobiota bacterium]